MTRWELEMKYAAALAENAKLVASNAELRQEVGALTALVAELSAKMAEMEEALRVASRQAGRFRRREAGRTDNPKRPGRKAGQGEWERRAEPTKEEKAKAEAKASTLSETCPDCQGALVDRRGYEHWQWDIPPVKPKLTRFVGECAYCPKCRIRVYSTHAEQTSTATGAAGVSIGPRAKALASDMKHSLGLSYGKIKDYFQVAFGLPISRSGLLGADMRLAARAGPVYTELIGLIRQCAQVHADETSWRIGVLGAWLWVFTGGDVTVYTIRRSRGHEVVVDILGRTFDGVLTSDGLLTYDAAALGAWLKQKCLAHILRRLAALSVSRQAAHIALAEAVIPILREAIALHKQRADLEADAFAANRSAIKARLSAELERHTFAIADDDGARMLKHLCKHQDHLLTFLDAEGVAPTNNPAEQGLRSAVITRKTGGCNRTAAGADAHAVLASVSATCRSRRIPVIDFLIQLQYLNAPTPSLSSLPAPTGR
jgi:transposase